MRGADTKRMEIIMAIECSYCFSVNDSFLELRNYKQDKSSPVISYYCSAECLYNNLTEYMVERKRIERNDSLPAQM